MRKAETRHTLETHTLDLFGISTAYLSAYIRPCNMSEELRHVFEFTAQSKKGNSDSYVTYYIWVQSSL